MKNMLLATLLALPALGWAQSGTPSSKIYLSYHQSGHKSVMDSVVLKNGKVIYSAPVGTKLFHIHEGDGIKVLKKSGDGLALSLEKGTLEIIIPGSIKNDKGAKKSKKQIG